MMKLWHLDFYKTCSDEGFAMHSFHRWRTDSVIFHVFSETI